MVDAALLELEGVLFDTRALRRDSMRQALDEHGCTADVIPEIAERLPPPAAAAALLERANAPLDLVLVDLVAASAERAFSSRLSSTGASLVDGARDFVREAAARVRLAIVARARRRDVDMMLRLASLEEFFTIKVTADDVFDHKPSSAGHTLALERLGRQRAVALRHVVALEDSIGGVRAARRAGVRCLAVGAVPAHEAMEAHGYLASVAGHTARTLDLLSQPGGERVQ
jgi:beta-phosphoglucomutase-like phosphatase (HAD superfamily)